MTTLFLNLDIKPTAWESSSRIYCDPTFNPLYDECHARYPDYGVAEDLDAATAYVVKGMEDVNAKEYDPADWPAIQELLLKRVRGGLVLDRRRYDDWKPLTP